MAEIVSPQLLRMIRARSSVQSYTTEKAPISAHAARKRRNCRLHTSDEARSDSQFCGLARSSKHSRKPYLGSPGKSQGLSPGISVTTSNVHNRGDTAESISKDNSIAQHSSQARHAIVERAGSIGILVQTFEQSCTECLVKAGNLFEQRCRRAPQA